MTKEHSVTIENATDKVVISNLIQLYLYDMTSDMPFAVGADGRYDYDQLDHFWQHPYKIHAGEDLVGFALVIDNCPITQTSNCFFMAEFFILKSYRNQGIGRASAQQILDRHPGNWHVATITKNLTAVSFWDAILKDQNPTRSVQDFDGEQWQLLAI